MESNALTLSVDEFSALEERILRTVNLVKQERQARAAAEERANAAEEQISKHAPMVERLQTEIQTLHEERGHVRHRVEKLLAQLDALEL
jgi:predicted RNase H-like nuclease (RuvC/YqgF family)